MGNVAERRRGPDRVTDADHYDRSGDVPTAPGARTSLFVPETRTLYVAVPHRRRQNAELRAYRPETP